MPIISSISSSSSSVEVSSSVGSGKSSKSGGKISGFFFLIKNSSLFSDFLPVTAFLIEVHELKLKIKIQSKINYFLSVIF